MFISVEKNPITNTVIVPHTDLDEFAEGMVKINEQLLEAGFVTQPLSDKQALLIDGDKQVFMDLS